MLNLKAGDVFVWNNYPLFDHEFKPRRWFLFLGKNIIEKVVYQITATTQYKYYERGGAREKNNYFKISAGIGGFTSESIIDITNYFEPIPEDFVNKYEEDIESSGAITQDYVNILLKRIKIDRNIAGIIKKDIYRYFSEANFKVN